MVKKAGYKVHPADLAGRLGEGFGKGLADQLPKEFERNRLVSGLQSIEQEGQQLDPIQRFTRYLGLPGVKDNPQLLQTLGELSKQQLRNKNVPQSQLNPNEPNQKNAPPASLFNSKQQNNQNPSPSLTDEETFERAQQGYIPKSQEEIIQEGDQLFKESPAFYGNDINNAINAAKESDLINQQRALAYQKKYDNLDKIQLDATKRLKEHAKGLNIKIPANVYSKLEDKLIQSIKPKKLGGEGLTEQQATKKYGEELDELSRQYQNLNDLDVKYNTDTSSLLSNISSLQKQFEKRDDLENFADTLVTKLNVSPLFAYSKAYPLERNQKLTNQLKKIPSFHPKAISNNIEKEYPKYFDEITDKDSPLSIGYELQKKGYDPNQWLHYAKSRQDELEKWQIRQLSKPIYKANPLNEYWIRIFGEK